MMTAVIGPISVAALPVQEPCAQRNAPRRWPHLLAKLHEAIMGRPTLALAERLARSERWEPDRLRQLQLAKLRRLLGHAADHCPFYQLRSLPSADAAGSAIDIGRISLLSRDDLRGAAWRMCRRDRSARLLIDFTHGTSEERLAYFWDRRRQAWDKANRLRGQAWHGFTVADRELHIWPVDPPVDLSGRIRHRLRQRRDRLLGELQIDSLAALGKQFGVTLRAWRRFNPARLTAYPSALADLVRDARRVGCRPGNAALQAVFLTGEVTFDSQRRLIENALGVPTVQYYGMQEAGLLAFACEFGNWHVCAESAFIEIVRDGRPALPGELGEIVVTGLESLAMPIIRYCSGDIVRVPPVPHAFTAAPRLGVRDPAESSPSSSRFGLVDIPDCPCGRGLPVMPPVLGRATDFLEAEDGMWVPPADAVALLGELLEDGTFQVKQAADRTIEVLVLERTPRPRGWRQAVVDRLRNLVGDAACAVKLVTELPRSLFGKRRYVISQRTRRGLAQPPESTSQAPWPTRPQPDTMNREPSL